MRETGYANQLQQLRAIEIRKQMDLTAQAMAVHTARVATIDASDLTPDQKAAARAKAARLFNVFMGREMPEGEGA